MTLEDILKIDTCPFDDTVLDECITGNYHASAPLRANLCNLILRYLNLFWEKRRNNLLKKQIKVPAGACQNV